ncbi:SDR family NAD(P)-dependent oxidoreductase [Sphaerisporangium sp. TRM90804]|uniref:SDR family NAD(P)-dependent oxidoreductase n=1 Tax=Sphaerisporangium sp. TRM90804 TaxID=3031113 RepID=UPI002447F8E4|nr:SDR family NAD(P)-dependent oxidoreductase [Sphaerisporangium sp. TRM90804]MDH2429619.1 SDR family NAD(P)-dependent oxidoreductase [Sphaerisporangium sp. TRM90804]
MWIPTPAAVTVPRHVPVLGLPRPWTVFTPGPADGLAALVSGWASAGGGTVAVLPDAFTRPCAATLLDAVRHASRGGAPLVLLHTGAGGEGLLRTLRREAPELAPLALEVAPSAAALAAARDLAMTAATSGRAGTGEVAVDADGLACSTSWTRGALPREPPPLRPGDLVVVTGGLGGLGRTVARRLAERLGVQPVLLDHIDPTTSGAHGSLSAMRASGLPFVHLPVDVTDGEAVRAVLRGVTRSKPVSAVVHCAGTIEGGMVRGLEPADLLRLAAPKVEGLRAIMSAADPRRLKVVLAFGSILARAPHRGVGAYALANELLRREVDRLARTAPGPRYLTAEWSIWDGAGVAAETGAVATARLAGYVPIRLAEGLAAVERLLAWRGPGTSVLLSEQPPEGNTPKKGQP